MTILVTGATGNIGRRVVDRLIGAGRRAEVRRAYRRRCRVRTRRGGPLRGTEPTAGPRAVAAGRLPAGEWGAWGSNPEPTD
ncbi:NAD-dependent epimerase/dehydratase family protein [Actinokineospora sp.]|uniref:NAD-dependent epimerase/dehydratase family protein n=1 Tax=Actinokineospora sp. TaxID=1872133 RepID=UPI0040378F22